MSQKGSSVLSSSENPEVKYKKALLEIQKIHNANKLLKEQSEEIKQQLQAQVNELKLQCEHFEKEYEILKNEKSQLEKYLDQLQDSNTQLRKEYHNLEREVGYLNDVLTEQNAELKKLSAFKDEKGLSSLIISYQDKQNNYRKDIARQDQLIKNLKNACEGLENELSEERRQRFKLEDINNNIKIEINRYRELNASLISKNQSIVNSLLHRSSEGKEKYREAELVLADFSRQLETLKSTKLEYPTTRNGVSLESYETLANQKARVEGQVLRLKQKLQEADNKIKEVFEAQEKVKRAGIKAQKLQEEVNMLKSKLIVLETKQLAEGSLVEDLELKEFQEKVMANILQNDPLPAIKNSADSSHFQLMKSIVAELKDRLSKAVIEKRDLAKKYKSLKEKFTERAQKSLSLQQQNKILKGNVESYERLAERLQFQLQRSMDLHEEEVSRMRNITSNILSKKSEETRVANAFIRSQLDLELDKFDRIEKGLRQQLDTIGLELSTQKIKNRDLEEKLQQANEFLNIYKAKFNDLQAQFAQSEESSHTLADTANRYEQLYREERAKNEALLNQKQSLTAKITQVSEQLDRKRHQIEEEAKGKQLSNEVEIRKIRAQLVQARNDVEQAQAQLRVAKKQAEDSKVKNPGEVRIESGYYSSLEKSYNEERQKNRQLEGEVNTLTLKVQRLTQSAQKLVNAEDALLSKNDQLNDLRRKLVGFEKQVGLLQAELAQTKEQLDYSKKEGAALKAKLLETGQEGRKALDNRDMEGKRTIQRLNEEVANLGSELREERKNSGRLHNELNSIRSDVARYEEYIEALRRKENAISEELNQLRTSYDSISEEAERLRSEIRFKAGSQENINQELSALQERIYKLNQQNSQIRIKLQSVDNEKSQITRELTGLKMYLPEVEELANGPRLAGTGWQEQRDRDNLSNFVQRVKKILRTNDITQANAPEYKFSNSGNYSFNSGQFGAGSTSFDGGNYDSSRLGDSGNRNYFVTPSYKYDYA